ncbi:MAG: MATE family efflux transporter [Candidatus Fimivivens sp.]|nr:MATE family efflux transporter [Candidatus Fimivivens sp.]
MNENANQQDRFTGKMFKALLIPSMISYLGLAIGDIADAVVVGQRMGAIGLAAISLALPVYMIINVFVHGFGSGGSIRYAKLMGEGREAEAVESFRQVIQTAIAISALLAILGNIFLTPLLKILGTTAADGVVFITSKTYIQIIITGMPILFISYLLNYYLRNDEYAKMAGIGFTIGNLCDFALNIVFVLILDFGAAGAAWSTVLGQLISIGIYLPCLMGKESRLKFKVILPNIKLAFRCFRLGFSLSIGYIFQMFFLLVVNNVLMRAGGAIGIAVFNVVQNTSYFVIYICDSAAKAAQPLISTFCGEHNEAAKKHVIRLEMMTAYTLAAVATGIIAVFPNVICQVFGIGLAEEMSLGKTALRIFCIAIPFIVINILKGNNYQSCENEKGAYIIAMLRGALVLLPVTCFCATLGIRGLWWLYPITEILSLMIIMVWQYFYSEKESQLDAQRIYHQIIESNSDDIGAMSLEAEHFCNTWNADSKQTYFVTMVVEEVCLAILNHATDSKDSYIELTLVALEDKSFELHIRDNKTKFNPFSLHTEKANDNYDFDVDAMGMLIIQKKAKDFFYRRYQGFNTLVVRI